MTISNFNRVCHLDLLKQHSRRDFINYLSWPHSEEAAFPLSPTLP